MTDPRAQDFTLVFAGDIRSFKGNPLKEQTPFGVAHSAAVGDLMAENERFRDALERVAAAMMPGEARRIARSALDQ